MTSGIDKTNFEKKGSYLFSNLQNPAKKYEYLYIERICY